MLAGELEAMKPASQWWCVRTSPWSRPFSHVGLHLHIAQWKKTRLLSGRIAWGTSSHRTCLVRTSDLMGCQGWLCIFMCVSW